MNFRKEENNNSPRIELTSLVDVVFLLLLFFAVTTTFPRSITGLKIKLPRMKNAAPAQSQKPFEVYIDAEGRVYYRDRTLTPAGLQKILKDEHVEAVIVNADEKTEHGKVMRVLDYIKGAGVKRILIAAEKNAGKENSGLPEKSR